MAIPAQVSGREEAVCALPAAGCPTRPVAAVGPFAHALLSPETCTKEEGSDHVLRRPGLGPSRAPAPADRTPIQAPRGRSSGDRRARRRGLLGRCGDCAVAAGWEQVPYPL